MKSQKAFLLLIALLSSFAVPVFSQDSLDTTGKWKYSINTNLTLTLNSYSDNWAGSEMSALSWGWQFTGIAEREITNWLADKNVLKLAFGQAKIQDVTESGEKRWTSPKKSSDLIDFETILRFTLKSYVDPFMSARLVTQFVDMRIDSVDVYVNPLVITESFGVIRDIFKKPNLDWSMRLGGAMRQTVDNNDALLDSTKNESFTNDGGVEYVTDLKALTKDNRLNYIGQIKIYEALFSSAKDKEGTVEENYWKYPDITWENTLNITLSKFIMLNMYAQLLYDREIDQDVRFRETVGLSLSYALKN